MYASVHFLRSQPLTFILVQLCVIQGRCGLPHTLLSYVSFPLRVGFFISGLWSASPPSASALGILSASTLQRLGLGNFCSVPHLWIRLGFSSFLTGMSLKSVSDSVLVRPSPPRTCSADLHHVLCADCFASSPRFVCSEECDTNQICLLCNSIDTTRAYRVSVKRSINQFLSLLFLPRTIRAWWFRSPPLSGSLPCPALPCRQSGKCLFILPILWQDSAGPLSCYCLQTSPPRTVVGLSHMFPGLCTHLLALP